jgi:protein SCO1/2
MSWRATLAVIAALSMPILAGCGASGPKHTWRGTSIVPPTPASALQGTNWDGSEFDLAALDGKVRIVFFGYTFCPDVCPFALAKMKQLYGALGERADEVAVVFVSVDPQRDSVEKLSRYIPGFDQRFYGVRLESDELDAVAEGFGVTVRYSRPPDGGDENRYFVDHTGNFFVIDPQGRLRVTFPSNAAHTDMLPDVEYLLADPA